MRLVVFYVTAPAYKLCKSLNIWLPETTDFQFKYSIKNTLDFITKMKNLNCSGSIKLAVKKSFHLCPSYRKIETKKLIEICIQQNMSSPLSPLLKQMLVYYNNYRLEEHKKCIKYRRYFSCYINVT